jgi:hypothetical protein
MRVFALCVLITGLWLKPALAAPADPVLKKNNDAALRSPHVERIMQPRGQRSIPSVDDRLLAPGEKRKGRRRSN